MKALLYKISLSIIFIICSQMLRAQSDSLQIDSLKKVLLTETEDTNKVNTLIKLGYYVSNAKTEDAVQNAVQALKLSQKIKFRKGEGDALLLIGWNYYTNSNFSEAVNYGLQALKIKEDLKDLLGCAKADDLLNPAYGMLGIYDENLKYAFAGLKLWEKLGDKESMAWSLANLGNIYMSHENYVEGLKYSQLALDVSKKENFKDVTAYCLGLLGLIDIKNEKLDDALQKSFDGLKILSELGPDYFNFYSPDQYSSIGDIFLKQGDKFLDSGKKEMAEKKFKLAKENYSKSLKGNVQINRLYGITEDYNNLGEIDIKLKKITEAKTYIQKALELSKSEGTKGATRDSYKGLYILDSIQKDYKQAFKNYQSYINYRDSVVNKENLSKSVQLQMQYDFDKKQAIAKAEQNKKDAETKRIKNQQYFAIVALGIIVLAVIIIALIQFRNNKQKKKANLLLESQKEKVESTLTDLKSTQAQLIQSEKMASLGELTAGIAHEIQNPLNFVNNFSEVNNELIEELKSQKSKLKTEEQDEILNDIFLNNEKINHHGKRADSIVKGMLQHSRQTKGIKEPTDINALCDEYLRLSYHGLRAKDKNFNADFKTDFDESIGKINIVPQDIGRVLLNLFNNAFYAVSEKQKTAGENYKPLVTVATKSPSPFMEKGWVEVIVTDNGNGIPQNIIDKIFQPFFTTKPTGQGTGLGLSLSYDIITKEHNGTIQVQSKEGEGSTFIILLPAL